MNQLSEAADFNVSITAEPVQVFGWADQIHRLAKRPIIVDSVQINSLVVTEGISAKMIVRGDKDVRAACEELTRGRRFTLEKIHLRFTDDSHGFVVLGNTGTANLDADDASGELLSVVRAGLAALPK